MVVVGAGVSAVEPGMVSVGAGVSAVEHGVVAVGAGVSAVYRTWDGFSRSWSGCSRNSTWGDSWKTWVAVVGHRAAGPQAIRNGPATVHGKKYTLSSHRLYTKINTLVTHIIMHYKKYLTRAYSSILDQKSL